MSDSYQIAAARQDLEAQDAAIAKINALHDDCCNLDRDVKAVILKKINSARECGLELIDLSKKTRGKFKGMFKAKGETSFTFPFTHKTATIYMKFARKHPETITVLEDGLTCLKDALIASGALPLPAGHGSQALHKFDFVGALNKKLFDFRAFWGNQTRKEPVNTWDIHRVEGALDELEKLDEPRKELERRRAELIGPSIETQPGFRR